MIDFDIDILVIKLVKQHPEITLFHLAQVVKEASLLFNQYATQYLRELDIFDHLLNLDDDISLQELKRKLMNLKVNLYDSYVRASTISMIQYIKENFVNTQNLSPEELQHINDLFESLIEMQRLHNFIKHFVKTLNNTSWIDELHREHEQEKLKQRMEELSRKRISILREIEEVQFKIIDLKREKDKLWNRFTGKSKQIESYIRALEEKLWLLRRQFDELNF